MIKASNRMAAFIKSKKLNTVNRYKTRTVNT